MKYGYDHSILTHSPYPTSEDGVWFEFLSGFAAGQWRDDELLRDVGSAVNAPIIYAVEQQRSAFHHFFMLHVYSPIEFGHGSEKPTHFYSLPSFRRRS